MESRRLTRQRCRAHYVAKLSNKITGVKAIKNGSRTMYEVIEVTPDGREVRRFTDKKPEEQHSVVSLLRAR